MLTTREQHFMSGGNSITAEVFLPTGTGRHPAVLILHGMAGLVPEYRADIVSFAEAAVDKGMVAVLPHYSEGLDSEGMDTEARPSTFDAIERYLSACRTVCEDALLFMGSHARVNAGQLAAIGFSLGGHLALELGMSPPTGTSLKCVVDFFGPTLAPPLRGNVATLPPVLIHHGTADEMVDIEESVHLENQLKAAGKVKGVGYEFIRYPGQPHGFKGPDLATSRTKTVEFLKGIL